MIFLLVMVGRLLVGPLIAAEPPGPTFESDIRPILKAHCWQCHGEAGELKGELDTRLARLLRAGGDSGPAIVAGDHAASLLFQRVAAGEMPPGSKHLSEQEIADIATWIDVGAKTLRPEPREVPADDSFTFEDRSHWSFQPLLRAPLPESSLEGPAQSPLDLWLFARLQQEGLAFAPPADRPTLLRRLSFNLLGLPPTPEMMDRFLSDPAPDAYEKWLDCGLASPAYGERWGRHWLDIAGYADSDGVTKQDSVRPWAFKYRDYVIRAHNTNKPWDQFLQEQLAGDELVVPPYTDLLPAEADKLIATGFLRMSPDGTSGSTLDQNEASNQAVAEVIKLVSTSLLGLSVGCAQCHSHRYDPITHTDYYRLRALFEPAYDWTKWRPPAARLISQWSAATRREAAEVDQATAELRQKKDAELNAAAEEVVQNRIAELPVGVRQRAQEARATIAEERSDAQKELIETYAFLKVNGGSLQEIDGGVKNEILKKWDPLIAAAISKRPAVDQLMCLTEVPHQIPVTHRFSRGDFRQPLEEVVPGELGVLGGERVEIPLNDPGLPSSGRRLAYARHLTSGRHPLVARVLINRIWMHHFGQGFVSASGDFGFQGEPPSHPELLDWLAVEFMQCGWDLKQIHRLILSSTVFRQSTVRSSAAEVRDPENRLLARMSIRRLEAETLRDSLLFVSDQLQRTMYGPAAPVSLDDVGQRVIVSRNRYDPSGRLLSGVEDVGTDALRRTIYVQVRRSMPLGILVPFDPPSLQPNCQTRTVSTNAPQALLMLNDPFVLNQVACLADRIAQEVGGGAEQQFERAWRLVFGGAPTAGQCRDGVEFLAAQTTAILETTPEVAAAERLALRHLCQALVSSNRFLYVD